jgi:hypothetical protein
MVLTRRKILKRLLYIIPLLFFTFGIVSEFQLGIIDIIELFVLVFAVLAFLYQAIRNSFVGWMIIMTLYFIYLVIWVSELIKSYDLVGAKYDFNIYITWWSLVVAYLGVGVVYFFQRPKNRIL